MKVFVQELDVRDREKVSALPESLPDEFREVDILVNNAGLALGAKKVQDDSYNLDDVETMLATNVVGLIGMTTAFLKGMNARQSGHIGFRERGAQ